MGLLDRHKKPGGFRRLVNEMETTPPSKRDKLLEMLKAEDFGFIEDVQRCIFKFEEFVNVDDLVMCEIVFTLAKEPKTMAVALYHASEDLAKKFKKNLSHPQLMGLREEESMLSQVTVAQQMSSRFRIIEKARALQNEGRIVLKPYDSKYPEEMK